MRKFQMPPTFLPSPLGFLRKARLAEGSLGTEAIIWSTSQVESVPLQGGLFFREKYQKVNLSFLRAFFFCTKQSRFPVLPSLFVGLPPATRGVPLAAGGSGLLRTDSAHRTRSRTGWTAA